MYKTSVFEVKDREYHLSNETFVGRGAQGTVYRISENRCVKIYASGQFAAMEYASFLAARGSTIIPRLYEKGADYIVMEYFKGPSLDQYLRGKQMIPTWITAQIIQVLQEMRRFRFTKLDSFLRHIFVDRDYQLKVIDLVNAYTVSSTFPERLFGDLRDLKLLPSFLQQVKMVKPRLYLEWKQHLI